MFLIIFLCPLTRLCSRSLALARSFVRPRFSANFLTDAGAAALANALKSNRHLASLTLHAQQGVGIGARGLLAIATALLATTGGGARFVCWVQRCEAIIATSGTC